MDTSLAALGRNQLCWCLDFGLLAPRTVRQYISIVFSHSVSGTLFRQFHETNPGRCNKWTLHNDGGKHKGKLQTQCSTLEWEVKALLEGRGKVGSRCQNLEGEDCLESPDTEAKTLYQEHCQTQRGIHSVSSLSSLTPISSRTPQEANCGSPHREAFMRPTAGWWSGKKEDREGNQRYLAHSL